MVDGKETTNTYIFSGLLCVSVDACMFMRRYEVAYFDTGTDVSCIVSGELFVGPILDDRLKEKILKP